MPVPTYSESVIQINTFIIANANNEITANVLNPVLKVILDFANSSIGNLGTLTTSDQTTIVNAINSLKTDFENLNNNGVQLLTGYNNPNVTPPLSFNYADFYMELDIIDDSPIQLWQWSGTQWNTYSNVYSKAEIDFLLATIYDNMPETYTTVVYVNTTSPTTATIFDNENPPIVNDPSLMNDTANLYIGSDSSTWVYITSPSGYVTKVVDSSSNFYLENTLIDAGSNKTSNLQRPGGANFGGFLYSNSEIVSKKGNSDTVLSGSNFRLMNSALSSGNIFQLNALNGIDVWNFDVGIWTKRFTFSNNGDFSANSVTIPNATLSGQAVNKSQLDLKLDASAYNGSGATNTDQLTEGTSNLYFQTARVLATVLTGISFVTGGAIVSADSVLAAFGKLQKQISDNATAIGLKADKTDTQSYALSDTTSNLATGDVHVGYALYNFTLLNYWISVKNAPTISSIMVDIKKSGVSVTSTKAGIDATEFTSLTGTTPVLTTTTFVKGDLITANIFQVGSGDTGKVLQLNLEILKT